MNPGLKFGWHRAFLASDLPPTTKLVGVRIWDFTSGDGSDAHPGRSALSEDLGISLSTVDRALRNCRDSGWLKRTNESNSHPSRAWADVYQLTFPDRSSSVTTDHDANHSSPMTTDCADQSSNDTDRSSNEPLSAVTDDDPTEPNHQTLLQESALPYVSNADASASGREEEKAAHAQAPLGLESLFGGYAKEHEPKQVQEYVDAEVVGDEPKGASPREVQPFRPREQQTPFEWVAMNIGHLSEAEACTAETMLGNGISKYNVSQHIRLGRKRGPKPRKHLHPTKDTSGPLNGAEIPTATAEMSTP